MAVAVFLAFSPVTLIINTPAFVSCRERFHLMITERVRQYLRLINCKFFLRTHTAILHQSHEVKLEKVPLFLPAPATWLVLFLGSVASATCYRQLRRLHLFTFTNEDTCGYVFGLVLRTTTKSALFTCCSQNTRQYSVPLLHLKKFAFLV